MPRMKRTALKRPTTDGRIILPASKLSSTQQSQESSAPKAVLTQYASKSRIILPAQESMQPSQITELSYSPETTSESEVKKIEITRTKSTIATRRLKSFLPKVQRFPNRKQRETRFSIPKVVFQRVVREIALEHLDDCKFQSEALYALQTACEDFLVGLFNDAPVVYVACQAKDPYAARYESCWEASR